MESVGGGVGPRDAVLGGVLFCAGRVCAGGGMSGEGGCDQPAAGPTVVHSRVCAYADGELGGGAGDV